MKRVEVLTEWVGTGESTGDPLRPQVVEEHPPLVWADVTAQDGAGLPPDPNALVVELVCADAVLAALEADAAYAGAVLWSEDA